MVELKRCPCGEIPSTLFISDANQGGKWAYVSGCCCNLWEVEFRSQYKEINSDRLMQLATNAWNEAQRGQLKFPTSLRKMWTGQEVQEWLDSQ